LHRTRPRAEITRMHCDMTRAEMEAEGRRRVRESRALRGEVAGMIRLSQELVAQSRALLARPSWPPVLPALPRVPGPRRAGIR
jgi:hypothetical protein